MEKDQELPDVVHTVANAEDQQIYQAIAQNYFKDVSRPRQFMFTLTDLANACRLANVDYETYLKIRAYLPNKNTNNDH
jgi:hypothetical protein